jgi:hypothetical protein
MWDFLKWVLTGTVEQYATKLDLILANQHQILVKQGEMRELIMGAREQLVEFAVKVDTFTNACAAALTAIQAKIDALNAKIDAGVSAEELQPALEEISAHLDTVKTSLEAAAAGGAVVVPPPPPVDPPPVEEPL